MPGASDRPPTLAELNERASTAGLLAQNPNYAVRTWIKSATTLLEEGNKYYLAGDIDQAYVNLMKGLSIALELLPKHKDFNVNDLHYVQLRGKLNNVMETTDRLKALIQKRSSEAAAGAAATPAAFAARAASPARGLQRSGSQRAVVPAQLESGATTSPAPAAAPRTRPPDGSLLDSSNPNLAVAGSTPKIGDVISSRQLFDILLNLRMSVLILDVRSPVEFSAGHIGWKRSRGDGAVALGGTVNINPEWYFVGSLSSADVASNIMAFGAQSMVQSKLFECRDSVDLIVLHDASSMKLVDSDALNKIFGSIYQFEFERIPKRKPAVLRGGYAAWVTFLDTTDATIADWIEIGDGSGVFQRFYQPLPDAYERAALSNIPGSAPRVPPKPALAGISNLPTPVTAMDSVSQGMASMQLGSLNLGMAGLKNLGNTCFMNSVIQCLSSTIPLSRFFLSGSYRKFINKRNPLGSKGRMAESYASLMQMMWRAQEAVVTPSQFKLTIGELNASFAGSDQQDSQEFLAALLDALHEDLNLARTGPEPKAAGKSKEPEPDTERIPDEELLESEWRVYRNRNWSIIVDMFQGVLKSSLRCLTCGKTSKTFNPFMYLSLPIPKQNQQGVKGGPVLLDECLRKFSEEEILDGEDAWYVKRRAVKCLTIAKLPTVLLIHLKRFSFDGPFRNKVETYVHFQTK
nr:ubiquitin-specific protease doa4 [Polyrhizophydium stewartii]